MENATMINRSHFYKQSIENAIEHLNTAKSHQKSQNNETKISVSNMICDGDLNVLERTNYEISCHFANSIEWIFDHINSGFEKRKKTSNNVTKILYKKDKFVQIVSITKNGEKPTPLGVGWIA